MSLHSSYYALVPVICCASWCMLYSSMLVHIGTHWQALFVLRVVITTQLVQIQLPKQVADSHYQQHQQQQQASRPMWTQ